MRRDAANWETGAVGEARTAAHLEALSSEYYVLHDLIVPGSSANIDHLVVGPTGVWLIDTKAYSAPLRYYDGTVWHGKYPMRKETAAVARYATAAGDILKAPVVPVLCFIDNPVPVGASVLGSVRLVSVEALLALVTGTSGVRLEDVQSVARLARTLRTPTPTARPRTHHPAPQTTTPSKPARTAPARTQARPSRSSNKKRPTTPRRRRSNQRRRSKKAEGSLGGMLFVLAVLVAGCMAFSSGGAGIPGLTTTTAAPPPLDGPTIEIPSPPIGMGSSCVKRGEGWQIGFVWPFSADPLYEPVAYEVVSLTPGVEVEPKLWVGRAGVAQRIAGIAPNTTITISAQGIMSDGTRLAPTTSSKVVPDQAC